MISDRGVLSLDQWETYDKFSHVSGIVWTGLKMLYKAGFAEVTPGNINFSSLVSFLL